MLCDMYSPVNVYRETNKTDDWGNTSKRNNYTLNGTVQGYIQPSSGAFANSNQSNIPLFTSVMYAGVGVDVLINDRVVQNGETYQVTYVPVGGVSGIADHQEIGLSHINDKDLL